MSSFHTLLDHGGFLCVLNNDFVRGRLANWVSKLLKLMVLLKNFSSKKIYFSVITGGAFFEP